MTIIEEQYDWAYNPGNRPTTIYLILHHAAAATASPQDIHRWHLTNGWAGIAYHYYVRKNGEVYRGRPEAWNGGHTEGYGGNSIGICFEGNFENETMPEVQVLAGRALVADIRERYTGIIIGAHRDYNATACPGRNFPFEEIVAEKEPEPDPVYMPEPVYATLEDVPEWGREVVTRLVEKGILIGEDGAGEVLNISYTLLRMLLINDRAGLYE